MKYEKWSEEKIAQKAVLCKTKGEMKGRFPKEYAAAKRMGLLNSIYFSHMPNRFKNGILSKWSNKENVLTEARKYSDRKSFFNGSRSCYNAAKKNGWFEEACAHMPKNLCIGRKPPTFKWSKKAVMEEALKFNSRTDFKNGNPGAYDAGVKNKWIDCSCSHMETIYRNLTLEDLIQIFQSCKNKKEAREKDLSAYITVKNRGVEGIVFPHMPKRIDLSGENSPFYKTSNEEIKQKALQYDRRIVFLTENPALYQLAYKRGILSTTCSHMKNHNDGSSYPERFIFNMIKGSYPNCKKVKDMSVKIKGKPHIHGFDIDVYVPELNRGIEFDGTRFHSFEFMRKDPKRSKWSDEDIHNYHELKDYWFATKGIQILHIKGEEWNNDRESCINRCLDFLGEK